MVVLSMVTENQFYTLLFFVHHQVRKYTKNLESFFSKSLKKPILSHILFYLQDDDHKDVDFNGNTINFTCELIKI